MNWNEQRVFRKSPSMMTLEARLNTYSMHESQKRYHEGVSKNAKFSRELCNR